MATIQELHDKVASAATKVEKCKATITRHEQQLEKKVKAGADQYDIKWKQDDIKGATRKLQDAETILKNWQARLSLEIEKERFLNDNAPDVIKEFLARWKVMAFDWHVNSYARYVDLKEALRVEQEDAMLEALRTLPEFAGYRDENGMVDEYYKSRFELINVQPRKAMDAYLKERELTDKHIKARQAAFGGAILTMATYRNEQERLAWLEKTLEAERKAKMLDLIYRVNEVVGSITDASALRIDAKGNLNGIIAGDKGKAKVETIGAGGYNIQCFHYRTLVHEIWEKVDTAT